MDNIKHTKICIMNVPEGEKGEERIFEKIMVKSFQNLMKDLNLDVREAEQPPSGINQRDPYQGIIIKLSKVTDNPESSKREASPYIHAILNKINNRFFTRNHGSQEAGR